jgi:hypothetical protein
MSCPSKSSAVQLGRVGELITMASIERMGGQCAQSIGGTPGFDLIVYVNQKWHRVEVKSRSYADKRNSYQFMTSKGLEGRRMISQKDCDIIALCALDLRLCQYFKVKDVPVLRRRVAKSRFTLAAEARTFQSAFSLSTPQSHPPQC